MPEDDVPDLGVDSEELMRECYNTAMGKIQRGEDIQDDLPAKARERLDSINPDNMPNIDKEE